MANASEVKIPIAPLVRNVSITVRLSGMKTMRARLWLAAHVFRLGGAIAGCTVEIEMAGAGEKVQ